MAQRYAEPASLERMAHGLCPECGELPEGHSNDVRFWVRGIDSCSLTMDGVLDRINTYNEDIA